MSPLFMLYASLPSPALAGFVIDGDTGLVVVHEHIELDTGTFVFHTPGFHLYPPGHQVVPLKNGGHPVQHMVVGFFHVVGHHVFKGQHAGHIEIPGAGDQVLGVGVFRGQLIADQVAPVVQVFPVDERILYSMLMQM